MIHDWYEAFEEECRKVEALEEEAELLRARLEESDKAYTQVLGQMGRLNGELTDALRWEDVAKENLSVIVDMGETIVGLREDLSTATDLGEYLSTDNARLHNTIEAMLTILDAFMVYKTTADLADAVLREYHRYQA